MLFRSACVRWLPLYFASCFGSVSSAAEPQYLLSIAVTDAGDIFLADRNLPGVWRLQGEKLTLFWQGSKFFRTPLNAIRCVAIDKDGKLLAGDSSTRDVYRFNDQGQPVGLTQPPPAAGPAPAPTAPAAPPATETKSESKSEAKCTDDQATEKKEPSKPAAGDNPKPAGPESPPPAKRPKFIFGDIGIPMDIAVDKNGDLFVSDLEIHRIMKVAKNGGQAHEFVQVHAPRGLCMDADDNLWVVAGRTLVVIGPDGSKKTVVEDGTFNFPHTVAVTADKTAFVCDGYEKCIWKVPPGGKPEKLVSGPPLDNPVGMRLVKDKLYLVDPRAKLVFEVTLDGKMTARVMLQ